MGKSHFGTTHTSDSHKEVSPRISAYSYLHPQTGNSATISLGCLECCGNYLSFFQLPHLFFSKNLRPTLHSNPHPTGLPQLPLQEPSAQSSHSNPHPVLCTWELPLSTRFKLAAPGAWPLGCTGRWAPGAFLSQESGVPGQEKNKTNKKHKTENPWEEREFLGENKKSKEKRTTSRPGPPQWLANNPK